MKPDENASETVPMLTEQQQAEALHKQITGYGEVIYQSLYGMCTAIKQMRDSKLYKALGYDTFEAYTEEKLGMKHSQAYRYIAIAEKYAEDSFPSMGKIGMTKLTLLTALTEDQREELTQTVDLESTTVRELKAQISALQSQNAATEKARVDAEERAKKWYDEAQDAQEAKERNRLTLRGIIDRKAEQVRELEAKIKELESKPQGVAVVDHTEELDTLKAEIETLRQQLSEKPDTQLPLGVEPIYQTDSKALFKPYLTAAADAVNRLAEFIAQHQSDANYSFFIEKMHAAFDFAEQKIQAMKG